MQKSARNSPNDCNKICLLVYGVTEAESTSSCQQHKLVILMIKVLENVISIKNGCGCHDVVTVSLEADSWRKANNYFYRQFTFKVHRNLT